MNSDSDYPRPSLAMTLAVLGFFAWLIFGSRRRGPQNAPPPPPKAIGPMPVVIVSSPEPGYRKVGRMVKYFVEAATFVAVIFTILLTQESLKQTEEALILSRKANEMSEKSLDEAKNSVALAREQIEVAIRPQIEVSNLILLKEGEGVLMWEVRNLGSAPVAMCNSGFRRRSEPPKMYCKITFAEGPATKAGVKLTNFGGGSRVWDPKTPDDPLNSEYLIDVEYLDSFNRWWRKTITIDKGVIVDRDYQQLPYGPTPLTTSW